MTFLPVPTRLETILPRLGRGLGRWTLYGLLLAILFAFLIWPLAMTVRGGFVSPEGEFTLRYFLSVFADPVWMQGLRNSLLIGVFTTVLCLVLTIPLALLAARYEWRGKTLVTSLVLVPLILPPFVGAIGLRALLGRSGSLNAVLMHLGVLDPDGPGIDFLGGVFEGGRFWGVIIMQALHLYPIMYLNVTAALANLDPALEEAAVGLGAGRWQRFRRVTLPLITPGLFAGCTLVFIWAFTELGTPLMFDYYAVTPVQIFWGLQEVQNNPRPFALVVVMLLLAVLFYVTGRWLVGGRSYAMRGRAAIAAQTRPLRGWAALGATLAFASVTAVAVLPHVGVIIASFTVDGTWYRSILPQAFTLDHYAAAVQHPLAIRSIANSLLYASVAVCLCVLMGIAISYLTVRVRIRGGWLLDSLAMLPLAVPGLVMAFGYVSMTLAWPLDRWPFGSVEEGRTAPLEGWFDVVGANPNPVLLLIISYAISRLPYVVRAVTAGLEQSPDDLEEAARNLGASTMTTMRRIVVPLVMANILAGAILAFSFAMLAVSDSLILAQRQEHFPITKAIFEFFNRLGDGPYIASALGVWGMLLLTLTLVAASVMMGRRLGAIFRV